MPDNETQTLNVFFEINVRAIDEVFTVATSLDEAITFRGQVLRDLGLDEIDNTSSNADINRYNNFVDLWNARLREGIRPLELIKVTKVCREQLAIANQEIAALRAEQAESNKRHAEEQALMKAQIAMLMEKIK